MALTAVLEFGDNSIKRYSKQYLVSDCRLLFDRPFNSFSPEGATRCERVEVTVVAPGKEDLSLVEWFSTQGVQNGRIVISLNNEMSDNDTDTQILYFEEAKCFSLSESYDVNSSRRRLMKLAISAETLEIDGITLNRI
ncbi:MAG: hypothetical protein J6W56_02780 [Prevotella sp.]|nr:hypothetical protein [Prevotella sp.]